MNDAATWLIDHIGEAPDQLRNRMLSALEHVDARESVARQLAEAAMDCLGDSLQNTGDRSCAMDLLAADALLTHACQAAAEEGSGSLLSFTKSLDADAFATLQKR